MSRSVARGQPVVTRDMGIYRGTQRGESVGYFSNGSDGDAYRARWCSRCANDGDNRADIGCAVMDLHLLYNYEQHNNKTMEDFLTDLIPRDVRGGNEQCRMFRVRNTRQE